MQLYAPDPLELFDLVEHLAYKPEWSFELVDLKGATAGGLTLVVTISGIYNSYKPIEDGRTYGVRHPRPVPAVTFNRASWQRWLFEQINLIETHECMEWFKVDGERPFAPTHGPGENPYTLHELATAEQAATNYKGEISR